MAKRGEQGLPLIGRLTEPQIHDLYKLVRYVHFNTFFWPFIYPPLCISLVLASILVMLRLFVLLLFFNLHFPFYS